MFEIDLGRPTRGFATRALLLLGVLTAIPLPAAAEEEPPTLSTLTEDAASNHLIWAARACYVEATFRETDCLALLWVARKRAERAQNEWLDMLSAYSAVHANNPRAKEVRAFPWGDVPGKSKVWNRRWQRLRELVVEFASGQHADPCPRAQHWGGTMDHPQGRMIPARCSAVTVNTFYAVKAWRQRAR
jgi:hypothetical protein